MPDANLHFGIKRRHMWPITVKYITAVVPKADAEMQKGYIVDYSGLFRRWNKHSDVIVLVISVCSWNPGSGIICVG